MSKQAVFTMKLEAELRDQFARAVRQFEDALAVRRAETAGNSE